MQKTFLTAIFSTILVLSGCATTTMNVIQDDTVFDAVKTESLSDRIPKEYLQRANNLFIVFDASASATENYAGGLGYKANNEPTKLEVQREILHRMNRTIAESAPSLQLADFKTSIRSFGFGDCKGYGNRYTDLHQKPSNYAKEAFDKAVDTIACAHGRSNIAEALAATSNDLSATTGNISVVIVSDLLSNKLHAKWNDILGITANDYPLGDGEDSIKALRATYGDRLCVYNVWTGKESEHFDDDEAGYAENPATCGQPNGVTAERIATPEGMKEFMRAVLLTPAPPPPPPVQPVHIDCSKFDSDGDKVNDCKDKCPNTLAGTPVNRLGCWIVDVMFANDRSEIKPQYFPLLDKLATDISTNFSNLTIEVQGHTSSTASAAYNMKLSIRRAETVANYLNKRIHALHKLIPRGYGLTRPIDTNETEEGRANNRRVQLEVLQ